MFKTSLRVLAAAVLVSASFGALAAAVTPTYTTFGSDACCRAAAPVSASNPVQPKFSRASASVIRDPGYGRQIRIAKRNSRSTIVWNPWIEKAEKMGDLGPDGYLHMVCVESANADADVVTLVPGGEHRLQVAYSVETIT